MASKTTFDHWKVVFSWGKMRKTRFSQKTLNSWLRSLGFLIYTLSCAKLKKNPPRHIWWVSLHVPPLVRDHRTINIVCCSGHSSIWCWQSPLKGWRQSLSCLKQRSDFYFLWEKNSFNSDELAIKLLRSLAHGLKRDPNNFPENSWFAQTIKDLRRKFQIFMRNKQIWFCSADSFD